MPINLNPDSKQAVQSLTLAFKSGDEEQVSQAVQAMRDSIAEDLADQYREAIEANDRTILAQRGFRQLTQQETRYYQGLIDALEAPNYRQALTDFTAMPDKMMPTTIFDEIMRYIRESHPLLAAVNVVSTGYITEWLRNKHSRQLATWGNPGDAITKEITSAFEVVDIKQSKLSCYAAVTIDMLQLGPTWLDGYVRAVIGEAMAAGLEYGVVTGKGAQGEPVGLDRNIASDATHSDTTGYAKKTAEAVTELTPATYGALVAKLAKDEQGHNKTIDFRANSGLALVCSPTDYLTKVMPATTVQAATGQYVNDLFPLPTTVYPSVACDDGSAILALMGEYDLFVAGSRGIEYSDEFKFLDDVRTFKQVSYAFGRAYDNTSSLLLDITGLDPAYVTVKTKAAAAK